MKKVYILLCALAVASTSFAQTISNAGFESWRTSSAGTAPTVATQAPYDWASFDSLAIGGLEAYGPLLFSGYTPTDVHAQLFKEATIKHSGSFSAKIVTLKQDTAGIVPGSMANAQPGINIATVSGGGSIADALTYTGGTGTNLRITTVSAWVEYAPGKDSVTGVFGGNDSGFVTVQAMSTIAGVPTVVGTGTYGFSALASFTQVTANVTYADTSNLVDTVRIIFSSSKATGALDSSILYVDDVTMTGVAQHPTGVKPVSMKNELVNVYPNPAAGIIHLEGTQVAGFTYELVAVNGQVAATKKLTGNDILDVSHLASGNYFYTISDAKGNKVQKGKVTVQN